MSDLKFNAFYIIERAIEEGVSYGVRRAFKHTDQPSEEELITQIEQSVSTSLWEVLEIRMCNKEA